MNVLIQLIINLVIEILKIPFNLIRCIFDSKYRNKLIQEFDEQQEKDEEKLAKEREQELAVEYLLEPLDGYVAKDKVNKAVEWAGGFIDTFLECYLRAEAARKKYDEDSQEKDHVVYRICLESTTHKLSDGYIGVTSNYERRMNQHLNALTGGIHINKKLQSAFNSDSHWMVGEVLYSNLTKEEAYLIEHRLRPYQFIGWNIEIGGIEGLHYFKYEIPGEIHHISGSLVYGEYLALAFERFILPRYRKMINNQSRNG